MTNGQERESRRCPSCGGHVSVFFQMLGVPPALTSLSHRKKRAGIPAGRHRSGAVRECGLVSNIAFDPSLLTYVEDTKTRFTVRMSSVPTLRTSPRS